MDNGDPPARTLATGKSARIAIKGKGKILFIDAADLIAAEAKGNYVLLLCTSSSHTLRESISTLPKNSICMDLCGFIDLFW